MIPQIDLRAQYLSIKTEVDDALLQVAESGRYILGQNVKELEEKISAYCGCRYGVGVASGTDALLLFLVALGIGPDDEIITTPFSFIATADSIALTGATPVFADIDARTFNLSPERVEAAVTAKTKAILSVHLYGQPADMNAIMEIAGRRSLPVIEDCAQAIGAEWDGRQVGSFGDAAAFSFFPTKNLGGFGDGGMIVTDNPDVAEKLRQLRVHGASKKYHHDVLGFNSRLDEIQAAVLLVKLKYLDKWTRLRQERAAQYNALLKDSDVQTPYAAPDVGHVYNQYTIRSSRRDELRDRLKDEEIGTAIYYPIPFHLQKVFAYLGYKEGDFPEAERACAEALSLPIYPELSEKQVQEVCNVILSS